jgi:lipopolysaccharide/colanic/teichoic acid biosynthesis glycosyltransferase
MFRGSQSKMIPRLLKRVIDIVISVIAIIALAPLFCLIALAVKLTSEGPALFKQRRLGQFAKPFFIFKFRTMFSANDLTLRPERAEGNKLTYKAMRDPRITGVGRILRKYSLDELPQFYNVLKGDMSLVGPRPLTDGDRSYGVLHGPRIGVNRESRVCGFFSRPA